MQVVGSYYMLEFATVTQCVLDEIVEKGGICGKLTAEHIFTPCLVRLIC